MNFYYLFLELLLNTLQLAVRLFSIYDHLILILHIRPLQNIEYLRSYLLVVVIQAIAEVRVGRVQMPVLHSFKRIQLCELALSARIA